MRTLSVLFLTGIIAFTTVLAAVADTTMLENFTQSELDTNWEPDRQVPSDGVTSVAAFDREDVARIGVDSSTTQPGLFQRTEGIKTVGVMDFGDGVQVDLYVDPDWMTKATRAGLWVVGSNGAGGRDNLFAIIEFVNNEPCPEIDCTNQPNITDHEGWRIWDSVNGWTNSALAFEYGQWHTLAIELDAVNEEYHYSLNGTQVGTGPGGQHHIAEVFLNSYNYGLDAFPTLSSDDYAAHWHIGLDLAVEGSTYTICADYTAGGQVTSPANGECGPGSIEVEAVSETPLVFCVHPYTGDVQYSFSSTCTPPRYPHVVPTNGDLLTCVHAYTGKHRRVYTHAQCGAYERPNTVSAGI